ncbi:MAG: CDP-glycerol glycerophosphotransferase family protein [Endomicrobium sp.]|nr:CDP-glycerol glycerophosphotransferase family protein [Endomicrobium sp.]
MSKKKNILKLILAVILFFPIYAHAYLDPGTGSALVAAIFGLLGSLLFFSKNFYYKIKSKFKSEKVSIVQSKLAFLSEGGKYWIYYKGIIEELIRKKQFFTYYTMDMEDPAFSLLNFENVKSSKDLNMFDIIFVGKGNIGYARINNLKEPVIVTTTPNIGTQGYPISKPKNCKNLIHIFHSISEVGGYYKNSLDCFDTVILSGAEFEDDIRTLEKKRNLPPKKILIGGLPYIDSLIERAAKVDSQTDGKTVLVASTWNKRGLLKTYGEGLIEKIALAGYNIIVRPHPYSYIYELDFINQLQKELASYKNVKFDKEVDNLLSMAKSDIMLSDFSTIRFDYYFIFGRPIISLDTDFEKYFQEYEYSDLDEFWLFKISYEFGIYLKKEEVFDIVKKIKESINSKKAKKTKIDKEKIIANIGSSAEVIAEQIMDICKATN